MWPSESANSGKAAASGALGEGSFANVSKGTCVGAGAEAWQVPQAIRKAPVDYVVGHTSDTFATLTATPPSQELPATLSLDRCCLRDRFLKAIKSGHILCLDESMVKWLGQGMPGFIHGLGLHRYLHG